MVKLARCCLCCVASNAAIDDVRKPFNTAIVLATCYKSVFDLRSLQFSTSPYRSHLLRPSLTIEQTALPFAYSSDIPDAILIREYRPCASIVLIIFLH